MAKDVSFKIMDAGQAYADFDLTKDPDQTVTCAVQVLNEQCAVVGWNEVTIGHVPRTAQRPHQRPPGAIARPPTWPTPAWTPAGTPPG
ncbi:DUF4307 domain-containing protein [Kocuria rhizophila]|nr:DUF4307 domain-containing protein [Kocuria rhizophila]